MLVYQRITGHKKNMYFHGECHENIHENYGKVIYMVKSAWKIYDETMKHPLIVGNIENNRCVSWIEADEHA